jgi:hypothetical protein
MSTILDTLEKIISYCTFFRFVDQRKIKPFKSTHLSIERRAKPTIRQRHVVTLVDKSGKEINIEIFDMHYLDLYDNKIILGKSIDPSEHI